MRKITNFKLVFLGSLLLLMLVLPVTLSTNRQTSTIVADKMTDAPPLTRKSETVDCNNTHSLLTEDFTTAPSYQFTSELEPETATISSEMQLNYTNMENTSLTQLVFHLHPRAFRDYDGDIEIMAISIEEETFNITEWRVMADLLEVDLNVPIQPLEHMNIHIYFVTTLPNIASRFGYVNDPESYFITNWYPVLAVYDVNGWDRSPYTFAGESFYYDMAFYELELTVPKNFQVACSLPFQQQSSSGTTKQLIYEKTLIRDIAIAASPEFETSITKWNGKTITSFFYKDQELDFRGSQADELGKETLIVYTEAFGEYVWDTLSIVSFPGGGGMEYPGLVLISAELYLNWTSIDRYTEVIVHEIAHQYIPFMLGTDSYHEPYIDEPFAVWCSIYYYEAIGQTEAADIIWDLEYGSYLKYAGGNGDVSLDHDMSYWEAVGMGYGMVIYTKGALVLEMLRQYLGIELFLDCYRAMYDQFRGGNLYFTDFINIFNTVSGLSLDWFFNQWFYQTGLPWIEIESITSTGSVVNFTIVNKGGDWFKLPLSIELETPYETITQIRWINGSSTNLSLTLNHFTENGTITVAKNQFLLRKQYTSTISADFEITIITSSEITNQSSLAILALVPIIIISVYNYQRMNLKRRKKGK
ncbi:MAG: hypothetical protein GF308_21115 [Candidatus Heimdallarchaeota archaeon]|nr:hypothetical protein [Candidatus Heimdallarchaeota archaeon]